MTPREALSRALTGRRARQARMVTIEALRDELAAQIRVNADLMKALAARDQRIKQLKGELAGKTGIAIAAVQARIEAEQELLRLRPRLAPVPADTASEAGGAGGEAA